MVTPWGRSATKATKVRFACLMDTLVACPQSAKAVGKGKKAIYIALAHDLLVLAGLPEIESVSKEWFAPALRLLLTGSGLYSVALEEGMR